MSVHETPRRPLRVSFEFFPPKTEAMEETLWSSVEKLAPLRPDFVSVTYGAGGSTRERTHRTVARLVSETDLPVAAHLTTVDATRAEVDDVLEEYWQAGVRHIVALRGDPPGGLGEAYAPHPGGYANAAELTAGAKARHDFEVTVGCYPEKHPESPHFEADIEMLKRKVDAGASRAITQFFYDNDVYERYLERVRAAGIDIPIVPGIMPVTNYKSLMRMAGLCGASIPRRVARLFENLDGDPATRQLVAATVAADQCLDLAERGVGEFHFYTLNRAEMAYALCHMLGVRPT
ncbi:methylenetetrahydrofolate reductase [NAD(P)H] [Parvularcula dongshanensis]|uniref:Methylenetetrahydrofolate reductase n=1 Tax=Parvularcula dongshanensis TaxID=1173995 RepID=A0A840I2P8_9PROT|nr:methylenetetrahydrofolate reductase [NAD(P)H] [Parvularcula dongshanensis]MBB4659017.1 methylenetetrahydrofolate reductase (NADPH) [Parvularcula dongshanensis]